MACMPSLDGVVSSLIKCRQRKDLANAMRIHAYICDCGLEAHDAVGNYIVPMFVDCGSVSDAERAFSILTYQNVHSWTSLISGHIHCGQSHIAFDLYEKMQQGSVHPSSYALVAMLKECTMMKDIERGHDIHIRIAQKGFEIDFFLGSTLVDMYTKCGLLPDARLVFENLPARDAVIWNALIAGYAEHGPCQEALECFARMKAEDICPTTATFSSSLKACCNMGDADEGHVLHTEITQRALETDLFVGNTLIDMYAKFGTLSEAQRCFDSILIRDNISWNALIAGYAECGPIPDARKFNEQMQLEGIFPDEVTFVSYLKACASVGAVDKVQEIYKEISWKGYGNGLFVGNTLVGMYAKCGSLSRAQEVFDNMLVKDLVSWNALMSGYAEYGYDEEALECFDLMKERAVCQDGITCVCALKACGNTVAIEKGLIIHLETALKGFERDLFVGSSLVEMYAKCGSLLEAQMVFDRLPTRDVMCWNALISGYAEHGTDQRVLKCFECMQEEEVSPDNVTFSCILKGYGVIGATDKGKEIYAKVTIQGFEGDIYVGSALVDMYASAGSLPDAQAVFDMLSIRDDALWNALITGYVEHGPCQKALDCYEQMQGDDLVPNAVTFVSILKACGMLGTVDKGEEVHTEITQKGTLNESFIGNALIHMYAKCGLLSEAWDVLEKLLVRDTSSWNAIIKGYGINHASCLAVECFEKMLVEGVRPDAITFSCLLTACAHANLVVKGQELFRMMKEDYGLVPYVEHFNCMVDLLARSGHLFEAEKFLETMPSSPSKVIWTVLLSGCKTHKDAQLGHRCFGQLVESHETAALSENTQANAGVWKDLSGIEELLELAEPSTGANIRLELQNQVHEFIQV